MTDDRVYRDSVATVPTILADLAEQGPNDELVRFLGDRAYTRGEILALSVEAASELESHGVCAGDRVAIKLGNGAEFLKYWLGSLFCEFVPCTQPGH